MSRRRPVLLIVALGLGLTGCSSAIAQDELETETADVLEPELGVRPEVSCAEDLDAEVDATTECVAVMPDSSEEIAIRITVTAVSDGQAEFQIEAVD